MMQPDRLSGVSASVNPVDESGATGPLVTGGGWFWTQAPSVPAINTMTVQDIAGIVPALLIGLPSFSYGI
jgi:hypothetical protein